MAKARQVRQVSDETGIHKPGSETLSTPRANGTGRKATAKAAVEDRAVKHREAQRRYKARRKAAAKLALAEPQEVAAPGDHDDVEVVAHPAHYNHGMIETWDYTTDQGMGFLEGNVVKYVSRWRHKDGITDLEKALAYLEKLIEVAKNVQSVDNAVHYRPT